MNFIDITGHIFSLPTYEDDPIHLKYKEGEYIFWIKLFFWENIIF